MLPWKVPTTESDQKTVLGVTPPRTKYLPGPAGYYCYKTHFMLCLLSRLFGGSVKFHKLRAPLAVDNEGYGNGEVVILLEMLAKLTSDNDQQLGHRNRPGADRTFDK